MRIFKKLTSWSTVAPGSRATLDLALGRTYDVIYINYAGVTLAQMQNIRVEVNGKMIREYRSGTELLEEALYNKFDAVAGTVPVFFKRHEMKTLEEKRAFGLGTYSPVDGSGEAISKVTLSMDISSAAAAPVIDSHAIQSAPAPIGLITKTKNYHHKIGGGLNEIDNIPKSLTGRVAQLYLRTAATIEKVEVLTDNNTLFELPFALNEKIQADNGRAPQAGMHVIDFVLEGDPKQAISLAGVQDFRIKVYTAADTPSDTVMTTTVHFLDGLAGI